MILLKISLRFIPDHIRAIYQTAWQNQEAEFAKEHQGTNRLFKSLFGLAVILFILAPFQASILKVGVVVLLIACYVYHGYYRKKKSFALQRQTQQKFTEDWITDRSKVKSYYLEVDESAVVLFEDDIPFSITWDTFQHYILNEDFILLAHDAYQQDDLRSVLLPKKCMQPEDYTNLVQVVEQKMQDKLRLYH